MIPDASRKARPARPPGAMISLLVHESREGGSPVGRAALGSCGLSVLHIVGEWQWLVRQDGRDVAEGASSSCDDPRQEAEAVALQLLDPAPSSFWKIDLAGAALPALRFKSNAALCNVE
jgi:hypothetical protein